MLERLDHSTLSSTLVANESQRCSDIVQGQIETLSRQSPSPSRSANSAMQASNERRSSSHRVPGPCGRLAWLADRLLVAIAIETVQDRDSSVQGLHKQMQSQD